MKRLRSDFRLGDFRVSPSRNALSRGNRRLTIKHKSMAVLQCLADAEGEVVQRNAILDQVWPGMDVTDDVLTQSIVELRKAFEDDVKAPRYIETVPKVGFRLVAPVRRPVATGVIRGTPVIAAAAAVLAIGIVSVVFLGSGDRQRVIPLVERPSIAILPFENLSPDPDNAYLADGLTEEIRTLLASIPNLKVIARSSSRNADLVGRDAVYVGEKLGVAYVLEGTVRRQGDRLRIILHLIDTQDGSLSWTSDYERSVDDVFTLQDVIATDLISALEIRVADPPVRGVPTAVPEAYADYLKAKSAADRFDWTEAERLLRLALDLDPQFAQAFELLSFVYYSAAGSIFTATEAQVLAGDAARRASELDSSLAYAPVMYAATTLGPDYRRGSLAAVEAALRSRPNDPALLEMQTWLLTEMGYLDEALDSALAYFAVDPLAQLANSHVASANFALGRVDEAFAVDLLGGDGGEQLNNWTWTYFGMLLAEGRDESAAIALQGWLDSRNYPDTGFAASMIRAARDRDGGVVRLDEAVAELRRFMAADRQFDWQEEVLSLYLYFGFLDRYFELLMATDPTDQTWHYAGIHAWRGVIFRRYGYTAHPQFRELARLLSIDDVWDARGAPDFCRRADDDWDCS